LAYDLRDDRIEPTKGFVLRGSQDFAGIGGTERFVRHGANYTHYFSPFESIVLSGSLDGGHVIAIGEDININNRFFLGGDNFRGFKAGGVGPRDRLTGDSLGANIFYTGTAEMAFPLGLPDEFGIRGRLFTIAGSALEIDSSGPNVQDTGSLRVSAGFGISWRTPFGPIRIDFGVPLLKEDFDEDELIRFNFGTRF
jgi:outer membrane protein insertion porin family